MKKRIVRVGMYKMGSNKESFRHFFSKFPELFEHYDIRETSNPDIIFCGNTPPNTSAKKVFYTNEAFGPVLSNVQWSFSTQPEWKFNCPYYMRQPYYVRIGGGVNLIQTSNFNAAEELSRKTRFCNYVFSHPVPMRVKLFTELSKYKKIDAPGVSCQNMPPIGNFPTAELSRFNSTSNGTNFLNKIKFIQPYKFSIAFENTCFDGYTSEKIYQAMLVSSIPIFWGNPYIGEDFNTKSFINAHNCPSTNEKDIIDYVVSQVIELDKNDDKYIAMLQKPWLVGNKVSPVADRRRILRRFVEIFSPEEIQMEHKKYSQNGEDVVLWRLFESESPGIFVDVGAHDGLTLSNTLSFEQAGWKGLCVEAHPKFAKACMINRPNSVCVNAAAGPQDLDDITFYTTPMGHLSTLDKSMENYYKVAYKKHFLGFGQVKVPQRTLNTMLEKCGFSKIDFISIDVEGSEINVLQGLDIDKYKPRVVLAEAMQRHHEQELNKYMIARGYLYACKTGNNLFFCRSMNDVNILRGR